MRGKQSPKRKIKPDERYGDELVTKFINYMMFDGKKAVARAVLYDAMEELAKKTGKDALEVFKEAVENVRPKVEVRSRRVGGSNYQVPVQVPEYRQTALACKWIIEAARNGRGSNQVYVSLARELENCYKKEGTSIKKKEEVKRMADANKAFAQFA